MADAVLCVQCAFDEGVTHFVVFALDGQFAHVVGLGVLNVECGAAIHPHVADVVVAGRHDAQFLVVADDHVALGADDASVAGEAEEVVIVGGGGSIHDDGHFVVECGDERVFAADFLVAVYLDAGAGKVVEVFAIPCCACERGGGQRPRAVVVINQVHFVYLAGYRFVALEVIGVVEGADVRKVVARCLYTIIGCRVWHMFAYPFVA